MVAAESRAQPRSRQSRCHQREVRVEETLLDQRRGRLQVVDGHRDGRGLV
jgi:hypothetical protein